MQENVRNWVASIVEELNPQAPVLEVGAYNINGSVRDLFPLPYVGFDMQAGAGVDEVGDILTHDFAEEFNTVVCCETLEHVTKPWVAVERMARVLKPGGYMIITAPFQHSIHDHPGDYWRFTDQGMRVLFEEAGLTTVKTELDDRTAFGVAQR